MGAFLLNLSSQGGACIVNVVEVTLCGVQTLFHVVGPAGTNALNYIADRCTHTTHTDQATLEEIKFKVFTVTHMEPG